MGSTEKKRGDRVTDDVNYIKKEKERIEPALLKKSILRKGLIFFDASFKQEVGIIGHS